MTARIAATVALLTLAGCSSVPDALNPVEWYEATTDTVGGWFSDDDDEHPSLSDAPTPRGDFPNLSSVPERPTPSTTAEERTALQQSLTADRDNARYSDTTSPAAPVQPRAAASPAVSQPQPAPASAPQTTIATPPPPPPQVATTGTGASGGQSTLWPRRPVPERRSATPLTTGRVAGSSSVAPSTTRATNVPSVTSEPRPAASTAASTRVPSTQFDSAGAGRQPQQRAAAPSAPAPAAAPSSQSAAPAETSSAVIVDDAQLQQFQQIGFSGPAYLVGTINFSHGSAGLSGAERELVGQIAAAANETDAFVRVVGHASARTAEMSLSQHELVNFEISLARAQAVAAALVQAGLPDQRVLVEAMSASQPLYFESMPSGEAGNRRVEILFQY
jgi:flagellar motor protein MotB